MRSKGLALPVNILVIMIIVVIVLVTLIAVFIGTSGQNINTTDANKIFAQGCQKYCSSASLDEAYLSSYEIAQNDKTFLNACISLGYGTTEYPIKCLDTCGCDTTATREDINRRMQQLITKMGNA